MSIIRAISPSPCGLIAVLILAKVLSTPASAGENPSGTPIPILSTTVQPGSLPDCADFSIPIVAFFSDGKPSNWLERPISLELRPVMKATLDETSGSVALSYEPRWRNGNSDNWTPQSKRERNEQRFEHRDLVAKAYYDAKGIIEGLAEWIHLDRSYLNDVELQETSYGTRLKQDAHDIRSVLSPNRISLILPLYQRGLTAVSVELNADKLYQAVKGDVPQLRGGLNVRF